MKEIKDMNPIEINQKEIKYTLNKQCMLEVSKYFKSFEDYYNLEIGCKKFRGNLEQLKFNPIELNETLLQYFPNIKTFHLYSQNDELLELTKNLNHCIWYNVSYDKAKELQQQYNCECKNVTYSVDNRKIDCDDNCTSFIIPNGIHKLDDKCFSYCSELETLTIPNSVTHIGCNCFSGCKKLTSMKIGKQWMLRGNRIFNNKSLFQGVDIPRSVTQINGKERPDIDLIYITVPTHVIQLRDFCFTSSRTVRKIFLPSTVTSIGKQCFAHCSLLEELVFP